MLKQETLGMDSVSVNPRLAAAEALMHFCRAARLLDADMESLYPQNRDVGTERSRQGQEDQETSEQGTA
jgi:hypothetical protein